MSWDHDTWVKAWGKNETWIANLDYRLPKDPPGAVFLALRVLEDDVPAVDVFLVHPTTGERLGAFYRSDPDRHRVEEQAEAAKQAYLLLLEEKSKGDDGESGGAVLGESGDPVEEPEPAPVPGPADPERGEVSV